MKSHESFMRRAIALAYRARGRTGTNPTVGAVIVYQNRIIGEGYHTAYGQSHAEIEALKDIGEKDLKFLPQSRIYVTLEPCAHHGKTPPCSAEIIRRQIPKVFIGVSDPFAKVNGKGIQMMKEAGLTVKTGIEEAACTDLIAPFKTRIEQKRPYIHLKWAQSKDGYITKKGQQTKISRKETQLLVHRMRSMNDAILVGTNTLMTDDPSLDNRLYPGPSPTKLVLDRNGRIRDDHHRIFHSEGETIGILSANSNQANLYDDCIILPKGLDNKNQLKYILDKCLERNIASLFVEGGKILLDTLIQAGLWDRADIIQASKNIGEGIKAPLLQGRKKKVCYSGDDKIIQMSPFQN
jgi:diaminohydroxyphosphoribosylaminopyrimidine deaminase/5-amino-6-(5-phosphoribosylamino)uracil reductase